MVGLVCCRKRCYEDHKYQYDSFTPCVYEGGARSFDIRLCSSGCLYVSMLCVLVSPLIKLYFFVVGRMCMGCEVILGSVRGPIISKLK